MRKYYVLKNQLGYFKTFYIGNEIIYVEHPSDAERFFSRTEIDEYINYCTTAQKRILIDCNFTIEEI